MFRLFSYYLLPLFSSRDVLFGIPKIMLETWKIKLTYFDTPQELDSIISTVGVECERARSYMMDSEPLPGQLLTNASHQKNGSFKENIPIDESIGKHASTLPLKSR